MNDLELRLYMALDKAKQLWGDRCGVGVAFDSDKQQWAALADYAANPTALTKPSLLAHANTPTLAVTELLKQLNEWKPTT